MKLVSVAICGLLRHISTRNSQSKYLVSTVIRKMASEVEKAQTAKPAEDTIFGKILRKEIPCKFIYEDDQVSLLIDVFLVS